MIFESKLISYVSEMEVLSVKELVKTYDKFTLNKVSFSLEEGRIMGLIGKNGAGKSTTLKAIINQIHRDSGEIKFWGKDLIKHEIDIKKNISFVVGGINSYPTKVIKVLTDVTKSFYDNWSDNVYKTYIDRFEIDVNKRVKELSEGMKIKYNLAIALSHNAKLLILDEPTSGLDPVSREELIDIFNDLAVNKRVTILFSTHITSDLEKCADDITYIRNGEVVASLDINAFKGNYKKITGRVEDLSVGLKEKLIGCTVHSNEFRAIIESNDILRLPTSINLSDASIEDIMIHREKKTEE